MTEHLSFIPNHIQQSSRIINVRKPTKSECLNVIKSTKTNMLLGSIHCSNINMIDNVDTNKIDNLKQLKSISNVIGYKIQADTNASICDKLIEQMKDHENLSFSELRENIYKLLTYNVDITQSIWYIITHFIEREYIPNDNINYIMDRTYISLKYFNNNYRPIYHIESMLLYITSVIFNYEC